MDPFPVLHFIGSSKENDHGNSNSISQCNLHLRQCAPKRGEAGAFLVIGLQVEKSSS